MRRVWISGRIGLLGAALALVLVVALGVWDSADDAITVTIFIGVPLMVAAATASVVTRRSR